jgi:hypothetical protein
MNNSFFKFLLGFVILVAVIRWGSNDDVLLGKTSWRTETAQTSQ